MMSLPTEALIERLAHRVPQLNIVFEEHQGRYGDQDPGAFLRTVAFILTARNLSVDPQTTDQLREVCSFLDGEFGVDTEIDALIAGSFMSVLPTPNDPRAEALDLLGPKLRAELERQWRGEGIRVPEPGKELMHRLAEMEPMLKKDLHEHVDYFDELLEHVLLGEITAKVVEWVESGEPAALARARTVIDTLEAAYGSNYEVDELIAASFVENLPYDESARPVTDLFGPRLRAEYVRQSSYQA